MAQTLSILPCTALHRDNVFAQQRSHNGFSDPPDFAGLGVSRCKRPETAYMWDIKGLSPLHAAFWCTQLAHSWPSDETVATSEMRGGAGVLRQKKKKKTWALMGRRKEEVRMKPTVPMIPCVAWQEEIHQWWTGVLHSHCPPPSTESQSYENNPFYLLIISSTTILEQPQTI